MFFVSTGSFTEQITVNRPSQVPHKLQKQKCLYCAHILICTYANYHVPSLAQCLMERDKFNMVVCLKLCHFFL